jgi:integral membrane protein
MKNPVLLLRTLGLVEGASMLLLVGIAMPLKYMAGRPEAVRVVGMIHGLLWVAFCVQLARTMFGAKWPLGRGALIFVASLIPFGPWLADRKMKGYAREFEAAR